MKKIVVPEEMLSAAHQVKITIACRAARCLQNRRIRTALAENPIVPTDAQIEQIHRESNPTSGPSIGKHWENRNWLIEWQRIMFKNHEPEAPESIKDLRKMMADYFNHSSGPSYPDDLLVEAYRRGLAYAKRPAP